ncbi:MAG: hypothetical protein ACXABY_34025 [Candidatus Thorarchaeota archaeon]|jgi:hypothetical protein
MTFTSKLPWPRGGVICFSVFTLLFGILVGLALLGRVRNAQAQTTQWWWQVEVVHPVPQLRCAVLVTDPHSKPVAISCVKIRAANQMPSNQ